MYGPLQMLLATYRTTPTLKVAQKIRAYSRKHPFTACLMGSKDTDLLADAIHHANAGRPRPGPQIIFEHIG